jgi:hypothetical protein
LAATDPWNVDKTTVCGARIASERQSEAALSFLVLQGSRQMTDFIIPAFFFFLVVVVAGVSGGFMADDRGRNILLWCPLCSLLPPFLLLLYFTKPLCAVEKCSETVQRVGSLSNGTSRSADSANPSRLAN